MKKYLVYGLLAGLLIVGAMVAVAAVGNDHPLTHEGVCDFGNDGFYCEGGYIPRSGDAWGGCSRAMVEAGRGVTVHHPGG